jgi:transcription initiation factor TFIIIB Brf1 subunit/transcription initiation factor TFIIB
MTYDADLDGTKCPNCRRNNTVDVMGGEVLCADCGHTWEVMT